VVVADDQAHTGQSPLDKTPNDAAQAEPSSLPAASSSPSTRRSPLAATPTATNAAIDTTWPASLTLT
jgi:hypothetical protein